MKKVISLLLLFCFCLNITPCFAEDHTPEPYGENEFPGWSKDLRRAEIITLGAMPFVVFNVSLCYSFGNYALHNFDTNYFVNPFSKETDANSYTTSEQIGIIITSLSISTCIGVTDFIVHQARRKARLKRLRTSKAGNIKIEAQEEGTPVSPPEHPEHPEGPGLEFPPMDFPPMKGGSE